MAEARDEVWFEITNLLIPTLNDDPGEVRRLADWVMENLGPDVPLHFTAFHPDFKLQDKPRTPPETLHIAHRIAREAGLHFVYEGNIHGGAKDTLCPGCGAALIRRSWHEVTENRMKSGCCPDCGRAIPGYWSKSEVSEKRQAPGTATNIERRYNSLNL